MFIFSISGRYKVTMRKLPRKTKHYLVSQVPIKTACIPEIPAEQQPPSIPSVFMHAAHGEFQGPS